MLFEEVTAIFLFSAKIGSMGHGFDIGGSLE
jgi:hypothetical protein